MPDPKASPERTDYTLHFTPAEWRQVIDDIHFLLDADNSYRPRRLMGIPVEIIPDHHFT